MTSQPILQATRPRLSRRVREVPPSGIRKFFDVLNSMPDVISLGVGEPDFDTPAVVVEAGIAALRAGRTHYTSNFGTIELRRALAEHIERRYGVAYDPEREIVVTVGSSEALAASLAAVVDPGDEVVVRGADLCGLHAGHHLRGWHPGLRAHPPGRRLATGPGCRGGGYHTPHSGHVPGLPQQPDRRGAGPETAFGPWRRSPTATT